jgi:hypothetical protein
VRHRARRPPARAIAVWTALILLCLPATLDDIDDIDDTWMMAVTLMAIGVTYYVAEGPATTANLKVSHRPFLLLALLTVVAITDGALGFEPSQALASFGCAAAIWLTVQTVRVAGTRSDQAR